MTGVACAVAIAGIAVADGAYQKIMFALIGIASACTYAMHRQGIRQLIGMGLNDVEKRMQGIYEDLGLSSRDASESASRGNVMAVVARLHETALSANSAPFGADTAGSADELHQNFRDDDKTKSLQIIKGYIDTLTASIQQAIEDMGRAATMAKSSGESVDHGMESVGQTVNVINTIGHFLNDSFTNYQRLEEQLGTISEIVGNIRSIATQTNLLALNAAIEAAHAGDAGRSFAVVAGEVKQLAERARQSSEQIGDIAASLKQVSRTAIDDAERAKLSAADGVERAHEALVAMESIIEGAKRRVIIVRQISDALNKQFVLSTNLTKEIEELRSATA